MNPIFLIFNKANGQQKRKKQKTEIEKNWNWNKQKKLRQLKQKTILNIIRRYGYEKVCKE